MKEIRCIESYNCIAVGLKLFFRLGYDFMWEIVLIFFMEFQMVRESYLLCQLIMGIFIYFCEGEYIQLICLVELWGVGCSVISIGW